MRNVSAPLAALLCSAALTACGGSTPAPSDAGAGADAPEVSACTPSRDAWNATVRPLVAQRSGNCHGATPSFGAPHSLLDYDALVRVTNGRRPVDAIAPRLVDNTMPPQGASMPFPAREAIAQWASCGAQRPVMGTALMATAPTFPAPARPLTGVPHFDILATRFPVAQNVDDHYQCFAFDAPVTEPRFVRRLEAVLDQARVVHHIVLLRDPDRSTAATPTFRCTSMPASSQYLYAWAAGVNAFEFPEGGLRVTPGQRFVLQVHYNNGARIPPVVDSSGVRLFHDAPRGTEYGMVAIGPQGFSIPPRSRGMASSNCTLRAGTTILAGMPHMHEVGTAFTQTILRANGMREPLIGLTGWRFDSQLIYDLRKTLAMGDRIETRCDYDNRTSDTVRSGSGTRDEMCFNFAYVTPPPALAYCDEGTIDVERVPYGPGSCAPADAPTDLPLVNAQLQVGAAPAARGGAIPEGRYVLQGLEMWLNGVNTGLGNLDLAMTRVRSRGQAWVRGGRFTTDSVAGLHLVTTTGVVFDRGLPVGLSGPFEATGASPLRVRADCGTRGDVALPYTVSGDELSVAAPEQGIGSLRFVVRYLFRRAP